MSEDERYKAMTFIIKHKPLDEPEAAVLARAKEGDEAATMALLAAYVPAMKRAVRRFGKFGGDEFDVDEAQAAAVEGVLTAVRDCDSPEQLPGFVYNKVSEAVADAMAPTGIHVPPRIRRRYYNFMRQSDGNVDRALVLAEASRLLSRESFIAAHYALATETVEVHESSSDDEEAADTIEHGAPLWGEDRDDYEAAEDRLLAAHLLSELPEPDATVVRLAFGFDGEALDDGEIADRTGLSRQKVQRVRTRALVRLQESALAEQPSTD